MKTGTKSAVVGALAMACAPVIAHATVLFTDNFDAGTSATRYDTFIFDRAGQNDAAANFNFNYGAFTYYHISADEANQNEADPIPVAPRTVGGTTIGLRLDVNNDGTAPSPNTAVINAYPKLSEYLGAALPSGDHKLTVDVWINYNGRFEGGGGSTEHASVGMNQQGGGIGGGTPVAPPGGPYNGLGFTVNGERGNAFDYRFWNANTRIGGTDGVGAEVGYVAIDEGAGNPGPGDGLNQFYQNSFPFLNPNDANDQWYETPGGIGKHWTTLEMKYEDGIIYTYLTPAGSTNPPILIGARTEESPTSGHAMVGYVDLNNGTAALDPSSGADANFVVYDNLVVETVTQTRQKWAVAGTANWSNALAWENNDIADGITEVADFTTFLPSSQIVFVDSARTVRSITFDSGNASTGYTLSGANTVTLDSLTPGIRGKVKVVSGSHTIAAQLRSERPLTFDVAAGAQVTVQNLVLDIDVPAGHTEAPNAILKNGAGVAAVNRIVLADEDGLTTTTPSMTINAGTLRLSQNGTSANTSVVSGLTINAGGKLDVTNNKVVVKSTAAATFGSWNGTAYTGIQGLIQAGRADGSWSGDGIVTSMTDATTSVLTSVVVGNGAEIRGLSGTGTDTWGGQTVGANDVLIMYTWGGDADMNGELTGDDYFFIDSNILTQIKGYHNGDFDYNGEINGDDYFIIDANFTFAQNSPPFESGSGGGGLAAVPEPASLSMLAMGAAAMLRRRRRS
jgi:hypothetical protein